MTSIRGILLLLLATMSLAAAEPAEGWTRLKAGMASKEMAALLGAPLIKSGGRQFEVWIYDAGAEVVCFRGSVVAWTSPEGSATGEGRQITVVAAPPPPPPPPAKPVYVPRGEKDAGFERISTRGARLRRW